MEKSNYNKELNRLIAEANQIEEKSKLDLDTIKFLDKEALKLEEIIDSPNSTSQQIKDAVIKLETLYKRIEREMGDVPFNDVDIDRIEKELKNLKFQNRG